MNSINLNMSRTVALKPVLNFGGNAFVECTKQYPCRTRNAIATLNNGGRFTRSGNSVDDSITLSAFDKFKNIRLFWGEFHTNKYSQVPA